MRSQRLWCELAEKRHVASDATRGDALSLGIEYHRERDGRWLADISALPGVTAYGLTKREATAAAQSLALRLIADRLAHGEAVPT